MIKTSRKALEITLAKVIKEIKFDRNKVESIKEAMFKHGLMRGKMQRIINGEIGMEILDDATFCLLTMTLYNETNIMAINPYRLFSPEEIEDAKRLKNAQFVENKLFPVVFQNVIQIDEKNYVLLENVKTLIKLYNSNVLDYNYDITRNYKFVRNITGKLTKTLDVNMREVREMAEKIINNQQPVNKIVINVLDEKTSNINYITESRKLLIINGQIDIVNGIHTLNALAYIIEHNPDFDTKVELEIKHYTLHEIKHYYNQLKLKGGVN
jgi:hypothetical protein